MLGGSVLAGEGAHPAPHGAPGGESQAPTATEQDAQLQKELGRGYALLYELVSSLTHVDELLLIKVASDEVKSLTDDVAQSMTEIAEMLEETAASNSFDLEDTGTPRFAGETRQSMTRSRIKSFAPMVGETGADFERSLLHTQSGNLNQMRHLTEVLVEAEPADKRKAFLRDANDRIDALYDRVSALLQQQYYCNP